MKLEFTFVKEVPGKWPDFGTQGRFLPPGVDGNANSSLPEWLIPYTAPETATSDQPSKPAASLPSESGPKPVAANVAATATTAAAKAPAYPTSSKSGPKDWDSIGNEDDDEDDAKDVDHFFKQLYKGSTPEQQRAMMKSYLESNGTALSTDWNEVSKGKVETSPPNGMEAKKWDA